MLINKQLKNGKKRGWYIWAISHNLEVKALYGDGETRRERGASR